MKTTLLKVILGLAAVMSLNAQAKLNDPDDAMNDLDRVNDSISKYLAEGLTAKAGEQIKMKKEIELTVQQWLKDSGKGKGNVKGIISNMSEAEIKDLHRVKVANADYLVTMSDGKCVTIPASPASADACKAPATSGTSQASMNGTSDDIVTSAQLNQMKYSNSANSLAQMPTAGTR